MVAELLAPVHVADVHLDERRAQRSAAVAQRDRRVRPGAGIEHDGRAGVGGFVQPAQQLALVVGPPDL
jgi:hypothetical protein